MIIKIEPYHCVFFVAKLKQSNASHVLADVNRRNKLAQEFANFLDVLIPDAG